VGETEAAALMSVGDWKGAKAGYEQALSERPKSGFSLYGLALCSERAVYCRWAVALLVIDWGIPNNVGWTNFDGIAYASKNR